jgi:FKBP-type peptidyl-prolyl cis-trans isomerase
MKSSRFLALICAAVAVAGCDTAAPGDAATDTAAEADTTLVGSYARGLITGRRSQSAVIDTDAFLEGVRAGLASDDPQYTEDEMSAGLGAMDELERSVVNAEGEANIAAGRDFLAENAGRAEITETPSGLQYEVMVEGDGAKPMASNVVRVHYRGTTLAGETFDASYDRGEPAEFGLDQVISGWTEGVQLMSVGSKYKFYIPHDLAYNMQSPPGAPFGPGETLVFEIELLEILS